MSNLSVINITKNFRRKSALKNISCNFSNGITALLGPNGAGKSTLMYIISTLIDADCGTIQYSNCDIKKLKEKYLGKVSVLFQDQPMYKNYTAYEYLYFCGMLKNMSKKDINEQAEYFLQYFGIYENRNKKISTFSGGMRQRLALCGVFLGAPEIILLDEPSVGLDIYEREELKNLLCRLKNSAIIIISTHIVSDIENISDNIIIINNGEIRAIGTQNELIDKFQNMIWEIPNNKNMLPHVKTYTFNGKMFGISEVKPHIDAQPKEAELTDVYFGFL